ncbi:putative LRR receptor-like serine/threonine-protein kinase [Camellia lanceoleosa]|uniref:LRR receptor-like serine/threonine-protein kinase n=1 Tax=Camellia lanceoleosa TaxID=1840588 RepID=A0ACC0GPJ8_9ERIC|nr:putative LRR receptor-like serine/threonine-protein kinase [Camellia lanceoleosa]
MLSMGLPPYHVFTLEEMEDATNNFDPSNLAREGSQGQLYRGWLRDSSICLVKCLKLKQKHSQQSLQQHMEVISKLRHRHLVSVLGHCIVTFQNHHPNTASTVFIVLEHVANGSLRDHLTGKINSTLHVNVPDTKNTMTKVKLEKPMM